MNILRRAAIVLLSSVTVFCLLGLAWSHIAQATIRDRNTVKSWLDDSGLYDRTVDLVLENIAKNDEEDGPSLPTGDPKLQEITNTAFTPDYLRQISEEVLDGTYGWLEGETAGPEFNIDLTDVKNRLAEGFGNYATSTAASLPPCTAAQTAELANGNFDVWEATCLPSGMSPEKVGADLRLEMLANEDFLKDAAFTGEDITSTKDGQQVPIEQTNQAKQLQDAYQRSALGPYIFGVISILSALGIFFLSSEKRKGLRRIGGIFVIDGLILGFSYLVLSQTSKWLTTKAADSASDSLTRQKILADLLSAINSDVGRLLLIYTAVYIVIGVVCLIIASQLGKTKNLKQSTEPEAPVDDSPLSGATHEEPESPENKPSKPKTPRKIQL